jgi:NADPH-dependent ferric siderophore reductase
LEAPDGSEIQALPSHPQLQVRWFSRDGAPAGASSRLLEAVRALPWPTSDRVSVTLAGESTQVVAIRDFLAHERAVPKSMMYAVPYWKDLWDEERYHEERHRIMDEFDEAAVA